MILGLMKKAIVVNKLSRVQSLACLSRSFENNITTSIGDAVESSSFTFCDNVRGEGGPIQYAKFTELQEIGKKANKKFLTKW